MDRKRLTETSIASLAWGDFLPPDADLATLRAWLDEAYLSQEDEPSETAERHADTTTIDSAWEWVRGYLEPWSTPVVCEVWASREDDDPAMRLLVHVTTHCNDDYIDFPWRVAHYVAESVAKMRGIAVHTIDTSTDPCDVRTYDSRDEQRTATLGDALAATARERR